MFSADQYFHLQNLCNDCIMGGKKSCLNSATCSNILQYEGKKKKNLMPGTVFGSMIAMGYKNNQPAGQLIF